MAKRVVMAWTARELADLERMWSTGIDITTLSKFFGRSSDSIYHAVRDNGFTRDRFTPEVKRHWTPEEDARLLRMRSMGFTHGEIGRHLQRTTSACSQRCHRLKETACR